MTGRLGIVEDHFLKYSSGLGSVVEFHADTDRLSAFDFTKNNGDLTRETIADTAAFSAWVNSRLRQSRSRYGTGGYGEHRVLYERSGLFDGGAEPRTLHLGVDIWGRAGTSVYCPFDAEVHSFNFNDNFGDYGATIILKHVIQGVTIHSLYGHLDLASLTRLEKGKRLPAGSRIAEFGRPDENGSWPPHLHFQLIFDMEGNDGDYPGVCRYSDRLNYLENCPDPDMILKIKNQSPRALARP